MTVVAQNTKTFHRLALVTALLTMALVTLGGVVHNSGSSLACPDWPLCYGQVFPKMEGGIAIEHSHRLLAALVGLLSIGLAMLAARKRALAPHTPGSSTEAVLFKGSLFAVALVVFQGALGGLTVMMRLSPLVSTAHLATSQLFLATLLWLTFRSCSHAQTQAKTDAPPTRGILIALAFVYIQMLLGAAIRHGGAGVSCGLGSEAMIFCLDPVTATKTLWPSLAPAKLHMLHRFMAFGAGAAVIAGTIPTLRWAKARGIKSLRLLCVGGHVLWTIQLILGLLTIGTYIGPVSVTFHLIVAMLLWIDLLSLYYMASQRSFAGSAT